jgi:trk system potassium uptake protein TrkA
MPNDANIVAIVRNGQMFTERHDVAVEPGDRVIILLFDKRKIRQVERLFQEGTGSFV